MTRISGKAKEQGSPRRLKTVHKLFGAVAIGGFAYLFLFGHKIEQTALGYVVFCIGILCVYSGWSYTSMGKASLKWPSTKGWIKKSDVYVSRSRSSGSSRSYEFTVEYAYDVNGTTFTNNLYSYQVTYNAAHSKGAQELVSKYPEGSTVDVYYDPAKPENSVLLPGINLWSYLPYVAAIAFLAFGIFIYWDASKT